MELNTCKNEDDGNIESYVKNYTTPKKIKDTTSLAIASLMATPESSSIRPSPRNQSDSEDIMIFSSDASPHDSIYGYFYYPQSETNHKNKRTLSNSSRVSSPAKELKTNMLTSPSHFFRSPVIPRNWKMNQVETLDSPSTPERKSDTNEYNASSRPPSCKSSKRKMRLNSNSRSRMKDTSESSEATSLFSSWPLRSSNATLDFASNKLAAHKQMLDELEPPETFRSISRQLADDFNASSLSEDSSDEQSSEIETKSHVTSKLIGHNEIPSLDEDNTLDSQDTFLSFANTFSLFESCEYSGDERRRLAFTREFRAQQRRVSPLLSLVTKDQSEPSENNFLSPSQRKIVSHTDSPLPSSIYHDVTAKSIFPKSFPNIQATMSTTPGRQERSRLASGSHRVMKVHLGKRSSFSRNNIHVYRSSRHEISEINNSLKSHNNIPGNSTKKRKLLDCKSNMHTMIHSNQGIRSVQRKLLQTPCKHKNTAEITHGGSYDGDSAHRRRTPLTPLDTNILVKQENNSVQEKVRKTIQPSDIIKSSYSHRYSTPPASLLSTPLLNALKLRQSRTPLAENLSENRLTFPYSTVDAISHIYNTPDSHHFKTKMDLNPFITPSPNTTTPKVTKAPCNCKKSQCLKLYCECFANGGYCDSSCNCKNCANTVETEDLRRKAVALRLEKNPNAFQPKIESCDTPTQFLHAIGQGDTYVKGVHNKVHKHGCHCKKSACQKKYCECFQAGVPCGENCRCIDCKNQASSDHSTEFQIDSHSAATSRNTTPVWQLPPKNPVRTLKNEEIKVALERETAMSSPNHDYVSPPAVKPIRRRIDRDTWERNFSSPFEVSPGRERKRHELYISQLESTSCRGLQNKHGAISPVADISPGTPSPLHGSNDKLHEKGELNEVSQIKEFEIDYMRTQNHLTSTHKSRIYVYPLFGDNAPPFDSVVCGKVLQFLTNADLYNASLVNRLWSQMAIGDLVWDHANYRKVCIELSYDEKLEET